MATKKVGKMTYIGIMIAVIMLIIFLKSAFILILLGCLPAVVAFYADKSEDKMAVCTVASCNIAGVLPYVTELTMEGNTLNNLSHYFSNANVWFMMYGMAALGYALVAFCPLMYQHTMRLINSSLVFQLEQKREALVKEWGEDIRGNG